MIDQRVEAGADRVTDLAVALIVGVALVGAVAADGDVPLQVDQDGFTSFVPAPVAAVAFVGAGLLLRYSRRSAAPWVRWLGRALILLMVAFEVLAFSSA